jgi:hypothetical protein
MYANAENEAVTMNTLNCSIRFVSLPGSAPMHIADMTSRLNAAEPAISCGCRPVDCPLHPSSGHYPPRLPADAQLQVDT